MSYLIKKDKVPSLLLTFSRFLITRWMSLKWYSHPPHSSHTLSSIFLGSLCPLTFFLKKRTSLTIFNNPGEKCFISRERSQLSRCLHRVRLPHTELEMGDWSLTAPLLARLFRSCLGESGSPMSPFSQTRLCLEVAGGVAD